MPERPLSERMREDIYAGEYREAVAAMEAENAWLRRALEDSQAIRAALEATRDA